MRCSVPNCTTDTKADTKNYTVTFHTFPKNESHRAAWIDALGMKGWLPKDGSAICSEHFWKDDFYFTKGGLKKVKNGAVPVTLNSEADRDGADISDVCRICLNIGGKLYDMGACKLEEIYEQLTEYIFTDDDRVPKRLCWECAHRLSSCLKFKRKALSSQKLLADLIAANKYVTLKDVLCVNRVENGLRSTLVRKSFEPNSLDYFLDETFSVVKLKEDEAGSDVISEPNREAELSADSAAEDLHIKDEASNEIFFEEYNVGFYDSDDDKVLSEVYKDEKVANCDSKETSSKVKKGRKRLKVQKKGVRKRAGDDNPDNVTKRFKMADVKRRRTQDLDENLFTITSLTYEEQIAEIEKRQELNSYKSAPYKCTTCYRGFLNRERFEAHSVRHSDVSGVFECFICKSRMKSSRALRKHLTGQHTEKIICKGCPFTTRNRGVAREHEKWHAGTKYQCPHCCSEFDKLTTYMGHLRIKHVCDFVCELCGYTFVSKKGVDVHKKKKHRLADKPDLLEGPFCELCEVKFKTQMAYDRHLRLSSRHSKDSDPNRLRNDSQSVSQRSDRVVRRIERRPVIHGRDAGAERGAAGPVTCEQCGIELKDLRLYSQHFRRAHPDKNRTKYPAMKTPCMCEQCGRIFQSMALLKDHMWVHTGEKRFKCDRCPKSFTQKTNLVFHLRVHSATRPSYECPLCGKHFAFYNNRRRHMFIHTGLKPYKCDTCLKCFTTSGELRAHVEHVHMKKPWPKRARTNRQSDALAD
ncbi:zinc finger protein 271 isoform X1 [Bombyx mori]|uniref:Uncharacterized protein n=1 Tax=Bombyx mori TaxID=7091 RepID=A0A8R1WHW6_BOMMO|nr:uncharacterized protein LOC101738156 isoform X4 [Bombyx mori]